MAHFSDDQQATLIQGVDMLNRNITANFPDLDSHEAKKLWVDSLLSSSLISKIKSWDTLETRLFYEKAKQCGLRKTIYYTYEEWSDIIERRRENAPYLHLDTVEVPLFIQPNQEEWIRKRDSTTQELAKRVLTLNLDGLFFEALNDCSTDSALYNNYCEKRFLHNQTGYPHEFYITIFPDEHKGFIFDALLLMDLYYPIAPYIIGEYPDLSTEEWL